MRELSMDNKSLMFDDEKEFVGASCNIIDEEKYGTLIVENFKSNYGKALKDFLVKYRKLHPEESEICDSIEVAISKDRF